jgi:hypothetical protein
MLYYYPNRPTLIPADPPRQGHAGSLTDPKPDFLNDLEASGRYVAELKKNGDNCMLFTDDLSLWNRRKEPLRYNPTPLAKEAVRAELERLPKGCLVNLELMHYHCKAKAMKDLFIVHCLMTWKDKPLIGKTWGYSREILENEFQFGTHVILSPIYRVGFWDLFQKTDGEIDEGLVLKDPTGKLVYSTTPIRDVPWMLKIRKPNNKYSF